VSLLVAIGVNNEGYREILGICEGAKEDKARSISGPAAAAGDDGGLRSAIARRPTPAAARAAP
jgi:hypothetical protein